MRLCFALIVVALMQSAAAQTVATPEPQPVQVASGLYEIPSLVVPDRGPDGNTTILEAPEGLIVVDTGRHVWQSDAILAFARAHDRPIAAIFNTHWHLDHSSGNRRLKAVFPQAPVYTTSAIDRAAAEGGFLERASRNIPAHLADPDYDEVQKEEVRIFQSTWEHRDALRPDVVVAQSGTMRIAGRDLDVHVTDRAVTDADVWIYDPANRVAIVGDLVTMPVPYFETACPQQWRAALDEVMMTPFSIAIPGHGERMTREQFNTYRVAFGAFVDCVNSSAAVSACGDLWGAGIAALLNDPERQERVARYADYYVTMLRENGARSRDCIVR